MRQELDEKKRIADQNERISREAAESKPEPQPSPIKFILGNIVERKRNSSDEVISTELPDNENGFPRPQRIDQNVCANI